MKEFVRCKVCGYIMEAGKEEKGCPACGVPKTAFEPYKMNMSEKRRKILELHIHPIILHFPQAFTVFSLFLVLVSFVLKGSMKEDVVTTAKVLLVFLPLSVLAGFLSGLYNGKLRFKKLTTPLLRFKIILGIIYFLISVVCSILVFVMEFEGLMPVLEAALLTLSSACSAVLGKLGSGLFGARMPG